jgi:phosphoribosyl 1,2-cyclic phosphodiesterase
MMSAIGAVTVETTAGRHPGGVTLFKLSCGGASLVYATDCEIEEANLPRLTRFARGCDLLLCDGHYTNEEYAARRGWGHSAWGMATAFGEACGAKRTVLIHHAPDHTDELLDEGGRWLQKYHPSCSMGRAGEELCL